MDKSQIIRQIHTLVPYGSATPQDPAVLTSLKHLTRELIAVYKADGNLFQDPLALARNRRIYRYETEIAQALSGKTVLVTGGAGCVGQLLIDNLRAMPAGRIISADIVGEPPTPITGPNIAYHTVDVRDTDGLQAVFEAERPDIVFHLAAQRLPGLAEVYIRDTITTNVFGTQNVIALCERYGVEHCVFSSTGKCFTYFTTNVYAATKKLAEMQFAQAAREGRAIYGMVRFTHIVDNSGVGQEIDEGIAAGIIKLHGPSRHINIQNAHEGVALLFNALAFADQDQPFRFLACRNLGWPVSSLEIALYRLDQLDDTIPLYFSGVPQGYDEYYFRGQYDWSGERDLHALINALESPSSQADPSGTMLITDLLPYPGDLLREQLRNLKSLAFDSVVSGDQLKDALADSLRVMMHATFMHVPSAALLKCLAWGANPRLLRVESVPITAHQDIVELLARGLYGRLDKTDLVDADVTSTTLHELVEVLSQLPSIQNEVCYLRRVAERWLARVPPRPMSVQLHKTA